MSDPTKLSNKDFRSSDKVIESDSKQLLKQLSSDTEDVPLL